MFPHLRTIIVITIANVAFGIAYWLSLSPTNTTGPDSAFSLAIAGGILLLIVAGLVEWQVRHQAKQAIEQTYEDLLAQELLDKLPLSSSNNT